MIHDDVIHVVRQIFMCYNHVSAGVLCWAKGIHTVSGLTISDRKAGGGLRPRDEAKLQLGQLKLGC